VILGVNSALVCNGSLLSVGAQPELKRALSPATRPQPIYPLRQFPRLWFTLISVNYPDLSKLQGGWKLGFSRQAITNHAASVIIVVKGPTPLAPDRPITPVGPEWIAILVVSE